ncbi:MAG: ATP-binding cassette domain-containing protein [Alistipes putredinis]|nr:MAG: ATP-binding cassette domain-containing protein [Alistipes putredinis]
MSDVNLDILDDDFIGVIGPNGGGKTTLVKAIMGDVPHEGDIIYDSSLTTSRGIRNIGYLPQLNGFDRLFPISVADVVLSGLQVKKGILGRYSHSDRMLACDWMKRTGIESVADKPIGEISGGQMQRALLCRAVISEPKMLILDEPTSFVDRNFERELYLILQQLCKSMAIVMVSHNIGTITSIVKSIVYVNGTVHNHGSNVITPEQLENYHLV